MNKPSKIHFIDPDDLAIDLAGALWELGHVVTVSCADIHSASCAKLLTSNLLPGTSGFFPDQVTAAIDIVIISRNIRRDNPELKKALEIKLPVQSPEDIILQQCIDKQRIVVIGNNSKTAITLMMAHVLKVHHRQFDFVTSVPVPGDNRLVKISGAPVVLIEGQDVMCSFLDHTPQFIKYQHHVGVISGIEWQSSADYPTRDAYTEAFIRFAGETPKGGILVYVEFDPVKAVLSGVQRQDILLVPYKTHPSSVIDGKEVLPTATRPISLKVSGKHNLQCISAAQETLKRIGITTDMFYEAISSFEGIRN